MAGVLADSGFDPVRFFQTNTQVRHSLIHDLLRGQDRVETIFANHRRQLNLIRTADRHTLGTLLASLNRKEISYKV